MATVPIPRVSANHVSHAVVTAAMKVHTELGPGLLESTYSACLQHELREAGRRAALQGGLPVIYRGVKLELGYRIGRRPGYRGNQVGWRLLASTSGPATFVP